MMFHCNVTEVFVCFTERALNLLKPVVLLIVGSSGTFTVIIMEAVIFPSSVVPVMSAVPFPTAVTLPFSSTVATFSSLDCQVTRLLSA